MERSQPRRSPPGGTLSAAKAKRRTLRGSERRLLVMTGWHCQRYIAGAVDDRPGAELLGGCHQRVVCNGAVPPYDREIAIDRECAHVQHIAGERERAATFADIGSRVRDQEVDG